ncbi:BTB/POZ domain-containing protein 2-like [Paramacrobiotus metropolitanus]|uniref:BTB/POZ domain-containing protein 2-like n=1 Tax=Paramacrobiotus metropolitanus TaxID=2943436 RepID=UPI002445B3E2|nr:BTB/POZ domain-containing protein 2-like [Paramacrobiotus metropolitanus]
MSENLTVTPLSNLENPGSVTKIGDCIKPLLVSGDLSDVQFAVGRGYGPTKIFPAHRLIMSVRSAVFRAMFFGSMSDNCTAPIDIPDILPEAFANLLSYIYTDAVADFTEDNVFDTLKCADKYDLPLLLAMCTSFALQTLNINNCLDILDNAVQYAAAAPSIPKKCLRLIDESPETIWESEQFCAIGLEALRLILQRDTLTANECTISRAVDRWATNMCTQRNMEASSVNRREVLGQTLYLIRFPLLSDAQLADGPARIGLLLQSEALDIYLYKHADIKPQLPFPTEPRQNVRAQGVLNYTIPNVRKLSEASTFSEPVAVRKLLWGISARKETQGADESAALSLCLWCSGYPESPSWMCQVNAEMRLLPWKPETAPIKRKFAKVFGKNRRCWGGKYVSMEQLLDPKKGYVNPTDFSLRLQVHVAADLPTGIE